MEFSTICRVCMQPISLEYIDLDTPFNETTYFECFNFCTKLEAKASDDLPKTICHSCANLLQMSYDFINAAVEADRLFHECFAKMDDNDYDNDENTEFIIEDEIEPKENPELPNIVYEQNGEYSPEFKTNDLIDEDDIKTLRSSLDKHVDQAISEKNPQTYSCAPNVGNQIKTKTGQNKQKHDTQKDEETLIEDDVTSKTEALDVAESIEVKNMNTPTDQSVTNTLQDKKTIYRYILPKVKTNPKGSEDKKDSQLILDASEKALNANLSESLNKPDEHLNKISKQNKANKQKIQHHQICKVRIRKNFGKSGKREYKCDECDESFLTLKQYKEHRSQNHRKFNAWFCVKCGESLESNAMLKTHIDNEHSNSNSSMCLTCGDNFSGQDALEQHVKETHWSRKSPVECPHCRKKYQLDSLPMHVHYAHLEVVQASKNKKYCCKYCFNYYGVPSDLEEHIKTHKGKNDYLCAICGKDFKSKKVFEEHKVSIHRVSSEISNIKKCNKCDFTTTESYLLMKHKKKHYNSGNVNIPKFLCSYCPKKFYQLKTLNDHEDYQHGEQKTAHKCDLCGKKFYSNFKLQRHKKSTHGYDRPFLCKECPKAFKLRSQLMQHEKYHNSKKIECPQCDKKFVQPCYLRIHLRTHTNELPFECHLCDKKFPVRVRLTYHLAKHEGIVRKCEYCPEAFDNMSKLRIHRFQHTGYPYACHLCKDNHHKKESLVRHMRRCHGIIMTKEDVEENRLRNMKHIYRNNQHLKTVSDN